MKRVFEALTTVVSVTVDDELPITDLVRFVLAGYPDSSREPELAFELRVDASPRLVCVGEYETAAADPFDLVAVLELDLYHLVAERAAPGWLLHAAALERDGRALVLAGPSGAGKTTLTLALLDHGFRIATEEMVLVDRSLHVRGLARPLHAPDGSPQHRAMPTSWPTRSYPMRGSPVRGVIAQPVREHRAATPLPLAMLVRIDHGPEVVAALVELPPPQSLARLWPCTLRQDDAGLTDAIAIVAAASPRELSASTVVDAVTTLLSSLDH